MSASLLPALTLFLALLYPFLAYMFVFRPMIGPLLKGGDLDPAVYRTMAENARTREARQDEAIRAMKSVNPAQKERIQNMVPTEPDIPGILVQLDAIAQRSNLLLTSIDMATDEKTVSPSGGKSVRIAMTVVGGDYGQFQSFLKDLERSERLFDVQSMVFTPGSGSYGLVLTAYFIDQSVVGAALPPP